MTKKKTIFSGIQPTGNVHLGNYIGAISLWVELQNTYDCIFCVVDYHAITVRQDSKKFKQQITDAAKVYIAAGIDPKKSLIFQQSDIKEHTELAWILNCTTARMSDLNKMTQFKDKTEINSNVSVGLFDYPVLMASDILLYNTDIVPVGEDQKQHVELARTLAKRFNTDYRETLKVPDVTMRKEGARIMGLDDATKKMSKSASSPANYIAMTDTPEVARKKIMKAQTDSDNKIRYDVKKKPAISNLLTIYSSLSGQTIKDLEKMYTNKGYGDFKKDLANVVEAFLVDFQNKFNKITDKQVEAIFAKNAKKLQPIASQTVNNVKQALGI